MEFQSKILLLAVRPGHYLREGRILTSFSCAAKDIALAALDHYEIQLSADECLVLLEPKFVYIPAKTEEVLVSEIKHIPAKLEKIE